MNTVDEPKFLRSNALFEPLVDRFAASLHTVAPVQAAMNLAFVQLPVLESYLAAPAEHAAAGNSHEPRHGYFVDIEESRADEVAALVESIRRDRADMLDFAAAVAEAEALLRRDPACFASGATYPKLPSALNGLVEIPFDTNGQPLLRFFESLVYRSAAYDERRQSVQLSLDEGAARPFILSTPRLPRPGAMDLPLSFGDPALEMLSSARIRPTTSARLREALELDDAGAAALERMLAPAPSVAPDRHIDQGGRLRYYGHGCLVFQTPAVAVLTDPFISADGRLGDRYTFDDLPDRIDVVAITRGHQDHLVLETLLQLRGRSGVVVVPRTSRGNLLDPSMGLCLTRLGFPVMEVDDFDEVPIPGGRVVAMPFLGEHGDLDIRGKATYCVQLAGAQVFVGGDSSAVDPTLYRYIRQHAGPIDMAFLRMECDGAPLSWLYQGLLTGPTSKQPSSSRALSGVTAADAAAIMTELGADEACIYAMGEESWQGHITAATYRESVYQLEQIGEFLTWCSEHGITAECLLDRREWRW